MQKSIHRRWPDIFFPTLVFLWWLSGLKICWRRHSSYAIPTVCECGGVGSNEYLIIVPFVRQQRRIAYITACRAATTVRGPDWIPFETSDTGRHPNRTFHYLTNNSLRLSARMMQSTIQSQIGDPFPIERNNRLDQVSLVIRQLTDANAQNKKRVGC